MSDATPVVSVLMPVYNAERYIAEAVESILNQTFHDFELIIIDDGSKDGSLRMLQHYARKDGRVRLVSRENRGFGVTLNEGLGLARGEFIARMDADDYSPPDRFVRQMEFLRLHQQVVVVGMRVLFTDEHGRPIDAAPIICDNQRLQSQALAGFPPVCHGSVMMRRSTVTGLGGYDPAMIPAEDLDLWLRMGETGELANLPEIGLHYRLHFDSICSQQTAKQVAKWREACERAWRRRGIDGQFEIQGPWRPGPDRASRYEFAMRFGWRAFNAGNRRTAIGFATKALKISPWLEPAWRLLACSILKPVGQSE